MLRNMQGGEWLLILAVVVLLFGARKLPELARSLGASAKEFRKGIAEGSAEDRQADDRQADDERDHSNLTKD